MSETAPTPKPTPKPWHEAAVREIIAAMRQMEDHVDVWINHDDHHPDTLLIAKIHLSREFDAILAKHDPANARPMEFRPGQVWRKKDGETRTIIKVCETYILWRWTSDEFHGCVYDSTYKQMLRLVKSSQLIEDPNATTPAPTSGRDHTQGTT